ncbi:glycosyltransferase family 32 protein [Noviherbaspirillum soli]|uniref:glycosyltransferase family 32 protein n=1 Tax=Noviherbaspirillum soli TaxID=1064518 RepID=UPI00188C3617|nr:glycosyltransferase [Noviherbaspirillum soli]
MRTAINLFPQLNTIPTGSKVPAIAEGVGIPKIIHQTFYDKVLSPELQNNVNRLKALNPGWKYRFYDDTDIEHFITSNYPRLVWNYFCRIDNTYGAARADLFRYLLMYKCGGVYLDIKSSLNKPLDETIMPEDCYLLSHWKNGAGEQYDGWGMHEELIGMAQGEYQQWHIACAPGHPFLKAVIETVLANIDKYNPALHDVGRYGVLRVTGPIAYTIAINRLQSKHRCRIVDNNAELGFEYSIYKPTDPQGILRTHYSALKMPIIKLNAAKKNSALLLKGAQRLKRSLAKLAHM